MRIIILAIHFPLDIENIRGGVHSAISNLLKGFSTCNIRIRLLTFSNEVKENKLVALTDHIDILYCPEGPFPYHSLNYLFNCGKNVRRQVKEFKPDLIHFEAGDAFLFTKIVGVNDAICLQTIHGIALAEAKVNKRLKVKMSSYFNGIVGRFLMPKNLIHLSQYSRQFYANVEQTNSTIIPNAIIGDYFEQAVKSKTDNRLLYVGVIDQNKNILFLLQAMNEMVARNKPFSLDILGDFKDPEYKREVEAYIEKNKLGKYLHFNGWVPQKKLISLLSKADILVVSSKQESLPMVIAESMAAGKLVIANTVGGIPEMIDHNKTGYLINNKEVNSLVSILDTLYNNDEKVRSVSEAAKSVAFERYHCVNVAKATIEFYETILNNKR